MKRTLIWAGVWLLLAGAAVGLQACSALGVAMAPAKKATAPTADAQALASDFWLALHGGDYGRIDDLLERHMREVVAEPGDALTLFHTGLLHAWKLSERSREPRNARVVEHAIAARRLFAEAAQLDPADARIAGFAAGFVMTEAAILSNEKQLRQGYFQMQDAVASWPEFNLFTSGYVMSANPPHSAPFTEGLEQQWRTLDACFGAKVSRQSPDLRPYLSQETQSGRKRACWNSWIAPHNWEGFFLNFGDMLARSGDMANARVMYQATRLSGTYEQWPYRGVAERRLANLASLTDALNKAPDNEPERVTMNSSAFSCMACHQASGPPSVRSGS